MFDLEFKKTRSPSLLAHDEIVVATYTLDHDYVVSYELVGEPIEYAKVLPFGYVLAYDPESKLVKPNYSSYGLDPLGVLIHDAYCGQEGNYFNPVVSVLWRGDVFEDAAWDNGDYGSVLQATKDALADRIKFVKETNGVRF